jgi:iron complex outermembrane recepter protein
VRLDGALSTERAGTFGAKLEYTHLIAYRIEAYGLVYELAGTRGPSEFRGDTGSPRDRAQLTLSWADNTATLRSTSTTLAPST